MFSDFQREISWSHPHEQKTLIHKSQSFEVGFSDHHHLIYTLPKSTFAKLPPKIIRYREFKNLSDFQTDLDNSLRTINSLDNQIVH